MKTQFVAKRMELKEYAFMRKKIKIDAKGGKTLSHEPLETLNNYFKSID
jgi:hypothetical protein